MNICYLYCILSQAEFPNYPKFCLSEIGPASFISDNRGSTVIIRLPRHPCPLSLDLQTLCSQEDCANFPPSPLPCALKRTVPLGANRSASYHSHTRSSSARRHKTPQDATRPMSHCTPKPIHNTCDFQNSLAMCSTSQLCCLTSRHIYVSIRRLAARL
jgi:hypothetical protein